MNKEDFRVLCRDIQRISEASGERFGGEITDGLHALGRMARKHHRFCEDYCNLPNFDHSKIDKQENKIRTAINTLNGFFHKTPLRVDFQRDCRGWTTNYYIGTDRIHLQMMR